MWGHGVWELRFQASSVRRISTDYQLEMEWKMTWKLRAYVSYNYRVQSLRARVS